MSRLEEVDEECRKFEQDIANATLIEWGFLVMLNEVLGLSRRLETQSLLSFSLFFSFSIKTGYCRDEF